jgi:hypothetical protein
LSISKKRHLSFIKYDSKVESVNAPLQLIPSMEYGTVIPAKSSIVGPISIVATGASRVDPALISLG